jgi:hypothetical protein
MAGVDDMIKEAEKSKNKPTVGSPNEITKWYAKRNDPSLVDTDLWCNMGITFWAFHSGNYKAVCFGMDFAATKLHSQRFKDEHQWHDWRVGHAEIQVKRGDVMFFLRTGVVGIGHIGLVHTVTPSHVVTIEANTSDAVRFREHPKSSGMIVGYGRPDYTQEDDLTPEQRAALIRDFKGTMEGVLKTSVEDGHALERAIRRIVREELDRAK